MRSLKEVKNSVARAPLHSRPEADRAVLEDLVEKHEHLMRARPVIRRAIPPYLIAKVTAVAAVVAIAALLIDHQSRRGHEPTPVMHATVSAAELLTVRCLNTAYRRRGMQGLESQCEEAAERVNIRPTRTSIADVIAELDGT